LLAGEVCCQDQDEIRAKLFAICSLYISLWQPLIEPELGCNTTVFLNPRGALQGAVVYDPGSARLGDRSSDCQTNIRQLLAVNVDTAPLVSAASFGGGATLTVEVSPEWVPTERHALCPRRFAFVRDRTEKISGRVNHHASSNADFKTLFNRKGLHEW
jgi:hypothetical protein